MKKAKIYYARMDEFWRKEEKLDYLEKLQHIGNVEWEDIQPDKKHKSKKCAFPKTKPNSSITTFSP